jgi:hypothetical protein
VDLDSDLVDWAVDPRRDDYERARRERVVPGSLGQPRLNPLASRLKDLEATIRETQGEFG